MNANPNNAVSKQLIEVQSSNVASVPVGQRMKVLVGELGNLTVTPASYTIPAINAAPGEWTIDKARSTYPVRTTPAWTIALGIISVLIALNGIFFYPFLAFLIGIGFFFVRTDQEVPCVVFTIQLGDGTTIYGRQV